MTRAGLCFVIVALAALAARAQAVDRPTSIELAHGRESLSNGSPDWQETSLEIGHKWTEREYLGVSLRQTRRFGLEDRSLWTTYVRPFNERLVASVEGNVSPGARFLARQTAAGSLQYEFASGWLVHSGLKSAAYENSRIWEGALRVERYVSDFSWSVAWKPVHGLGRYAQNFEVRGSYYYGDRNMVGVIGASGREATSVAESQVVLADVRSVALVGRHHLGAGWALTYALGRTRQGDFYSRKGGRLGVQYSY